jgi:hypothetical protein
MVDNLANINQMMKPLISSYLAGIEEYTENRDKAEVVGAYKAYAYLFRKMDDRQLTTEVGITVLNLKYFLIFHPNMQSISSNLFNFSANSGHAQVDSGDYATEATICRHVQGRLSASHRWFTAEWSRHWLDGCSRPWRTLKWTLFLSQPWSNMLWLVNF